MIIFFEGNVPQTARRGGGWEVNHCLMIMTEIMVGQ